ncbi:ATP-binding cassette domain-containing protein [Halorussus limi]|uniref:ATP-binding cassette domain-containing protein n=1 Tax=Halorussus limi TaxID=2938695 RepID=A0A8U0HZD4_9EURY|nr:ATP-binding cassette domain-containing protein [Halorussus limi]UPV75894.1 ATP-binding cassette domain-containing protein [Halorussus limi]
MDGEQPDTPSTDSANVPSGDSATDAVATDEIDEESAEMIRLESVTKQFGRVVAVEDVTLSVYEEEILALVGDNGAGKSTLTGMISGVHRPTEGRVVYDGEPVRFSNPSEARERGIETVYQDLALMNDLDIATNIHVGKFPKRVSVGPFGVIDWERTYENTREILDFLNQDIRPDTEVVFLSGGQRQLVAIGRALSFDPDVFVLDEPTSALSVAGTELVHETMRQLQAEGHTQVVVSHSLEDVFDLADRIAVMYRGRLVDVVDPDETDRETVTELITTGSRA